MLYFVKIITLVENANLQCTVSGFNKKKNTVSSKRCITKQLEFLKCCVNLILAALKENF